MPVIQVPGGIPRRRDKVGVRIVGNAAYSPAVLSGAEPRASSNPP